MIGRMTALALGLSVFWSGAALANDFVGNWMTEDGKGQVRLSECGDRLCSEIVWLREATDEDGEPLRDHYNPDPELRDRPIVGLEILKGLERSGPNEYTGEIYNPENGRSYEATIRLEDRNTLRLRGCTSFGWPCGEQIWTRASENRALEQAGQERATDRETASANAAGSPRQAEPPQQSDASRPAQPQSSEPPQPERAEQEPAQAPEAAPERSAQEPSRTAAVPEGVATQPAPAPDEAAGSHGYHVQIASRQSESAALQAFDELRQKYPDLLGGYDTPDIEVADLGARGVWYRVRVGAWRQESSAVALCERMKAAGGDCLVSQP